MMATNKLLRNSDGSSWYIKLITVTLAVICAFFSASSQTPRAYPQIGEKCPEFLLKDINSKLQNLSLESLKGKFIILDFWSVGCVPCVESFTKMNALQKKFGDKLRIILVGRDEQNRDVHAFYRKFQKKFDLNLASAIDSNVFEEFVPFGVPYLVWINPDKEIKAITSTEDVILDNVLKFTSNVDFKFTDISSRPRRSSPVFAAFAKGTGSKNVPMDTNLVFQSSILNWVPGGPVVKTANLALGVFKETTFQLFKVDLLGLYRIAYFGSEDFLQFNYYPLPILKVRDSSIFDQNYSVNAKRKFNYSLHIPGQNITGEEIMGIMQKDLKASFRYNVDIVSRDFPCLNLVVTDRTKLDQALKNSESEVRPGKWEIESEENVIYNSPLNNLPRRLAMYLPFPLRKRAYDRTGIEGNISLTITGPLDSLENIRKQIRKVGLDLVPSLKASRALSISEN